MKTMKFMLFAVAAMAAAACAKEVAPEVSAPAEVNYVEMEFSSALETTKTALNGSSVSWVGNETLSILDNSASPVNTKATTVSGAPGTFKATVPEATEYYAAYPYRKEITLSGSKLTNWYLAQVQTPYKGSFDNTRAPMIAKADADNVLAFRNIASHVRVTIPADMTDVMAITLMGNEDELITGIYDVDWNNGDPTYSFPKLAEAYPYVTLRKGDKTPIAPGEYYFTILPVEFKKGFTLIFAKTDETQVAVRTDKPVTTVSERNQIQPMKEAPSSAFKSHMNYFVHFDNGFTINVSGVEINSALITSKNAVLVTDTNGMSSQDKMTGYNGLAYFISPNCTTATVKTRSVTKRIIMGADASVRSRLKLTGHQGLYNEGTLNVYANLDVNSGTNLPLYADPAKFGKIVFNNCSFSCSSARLFNMDTKTVNSSDIEALIIENCEFYHSFATASQLIMDIQNTPKYGTVKIHNNIFYGNTSGGYRMLHMTNTTIGNLIIKNNTFDNLYFDNGVLCGAHSITDKFEFASNLFVLKQNKLQALTRPGAGTIPTTIICVDNYCFYDGDGADSMNLWFGLGESRVSALKLSANPLSDIWEPANGKFGAYTIVPAEGAAAPTGLVGAQRPDMDPVTAAVNSAAYGYETNDLGKL